MLCLLLTVFLAIGAPQTGESDLWYYDFHGPVKKAVIRSLRTLVIHFSEDGHITSAYDEGQPITYLRDKKGRIIASKSCYGALPDGHTAKYRQRACDPHGNWIARKTTLRLPPYSIATELAAIDYYPEE